MVLNFIVGLNLINQLSGFGPQVPTHFHAVRGKIGPVKRDFVIGGDVLGDQVYLSVVRLNFSSCEVVVRLFTST